MTLSHAFSPKVFVTNWYEILTIWRIHIRNLEFNDPDTNTLSHLILVYGLPEVTNRNHLVFHNCQLPHLPRLSFYRMRLSSYLRSFPYVSHAGFLLFWESPLQTPEVSGQRLFSDAGSHSVARVINSNSCRSVTDLGCAVKLALHCFSRCCWKEDRDLEAQR